MKCQIIFVTETYGKINKQKAAGQLEDLKIYFLEKQIGLKRFC